MADTDPFAAMGGGVQRDGGWIPRNMLSAEELAAYDAKQAGGTAPPPTSPTAPAPAPAPAPEPTSPDPFTAMGGGIQINGGWIPRNMATPEQLAQYGGGAPPPPTGAPAPAPAPVTDGGLQTAPQPTTPDPFTAMGGGLFINGGWIPRTMATAEQLAQYGSTTGAGGAAPQPGGAAPGMAPPPVQAPWPTPVPGPPPAPATTPIEQQGQNSQTYSQTPGAAPSDATTNQGTQDVLRNTYLERATQPKTIDANDPNVRAQVDVFAGQQDRQRRQYLSEMAEKASTKGLGDSGALDAERRYASEKAGQATGAFEAQLVGKEIENRRSEINDALQNLKGMLSGDQVNQLQRELAELDAAMKKLGIQAGAATAADEIALKKELGLGGLNLDLMRLLMTDRHFADTMGFNVADREQYYNNQSMQTLLGNG